MFKPKNEKYVRLKYELIPSPFHDGGMVKVSRIKAVRDIPAHGVLAGDLGGYLDSQVILEQKGDCWVGDQAIVLGSVVINSYALITDHAVVHGGTTVLKEKGESGNYYGLNITENARISGDACLDYVTTPTERAQAGFIGGQSRIRDHAKIYNARVIIGNTVVEDNATINAGCQLRDESRVSGQAVLEKKVMLHDQSTIADYASIGRNSIIKGLSRVSGKTKVAPASLIIDGKADKPKDAKLSELIEYTESESQRGSKPSLASRVSAKTGADAKASKYEAYLMKYQDILESIDSYASDIVKIIQYPAMTDLTDTHTAEMMFALKQAEFESEFSHDGEFFRAVSDLERKFLVAESNARKLASSLLSEAGRKKTEQAKDLFSLACNDASPEQERRMAFKQGFKRLEGVVSVPEKAVQAMRVKVGIAELEM